MSAAAIELLETSPLAGLQALRSSLPDSAHAVLREAVRIGRLAVGSGKIAEAASDLLEHAGYHCFEWRGRSVEYWELPDADSDLLFGNVLWPCAEVLSRLLLDSFDGMPGLWDDARCLTMGVPLEQLVAERFSVGLHRPSRAEVDFSTPLPELRGAKLLEIGCGVGLCGLACRECGASVTLSDGEERLVDSLRTRHGHRERLSFEVLDWYRDADPGAPTYDVILGSDVLHPRCEGEVHAPRMVSQRLSRTEGARALFISEVRRAETCRTAISELQRHGLRVSTYQVCSGREFFPAEVEKVPIGSLVLLSARWDLESEVVDFVRSGYRMAPVYGGRGAGAAGEEAGRQGAVDSVAAAMGLGSIGIRVENVVKRNGAAAGVDVAGGSGDGGGGGAGAGAGVGVGAGASAGASAGAGAGTGASAGPGGVAGGDCVAGGAARGGVAVVMKKEAAGGLHPLLKVKGKEQEALEALRLDPTLASHPDSDGMLPLHQVAQMVAQMNYHTTVVVHVHFLSLHSGRS